MTFTEGIKNSGAVLGLTTGVVLLLFIAGFGALILRQVFRGEINISGLISEPDGKASMSRLQLLIFTFVISLSLFFIVVGSGKFEFPTLSPEILLLLGISSSTTLVSKAISSSKPADSKVQPPTPPPPAPPANDGLKSQAAAAGQGLTI